MIIIPEHVNIKKALDYVNEKNITRINDGNIYKEIWKWEANQYRTIIYTRRVTAFINHPIWYERDSRHPENSEYEVIDYIIHEILELNRWRWFTNLQRSTKELVRILR